jgi:dTDP-4-amino-4,6-dideoxygalactose transaminase
MNPHDVTKQFEEAIADYCGSPYAVAVTSCTAALLLCCVYYDVREVNIPCRTYVGVGQSILNAGGRVTFRDEAWSGIYRLEPYPIFDAARRTTSDMFIPGTMMCLSLHISKICGVDQGGVILHDSPVADRILRQLRFDGRTEGVHPRDDEFTRGFHCYLSPSVAAKALWKLSMLPRHNDDLPCSDYSDLSQQEIFQ